MVVNCPTCQTRYHYRESIPDGGGTALCSSCGKIVPLVAARRQFVVRAQVTPVQASVAVPVVVATGATAAVASPVPSVSPPEGAGFADAGLGEFGVMAADLAVADPEPLVVGPESPLSSDALAAVPETLSTAQPFQTDLAAGLPDEPADAEPSAVRARSSSGEKSNRFVQLFVVLLSTGGFAAAGHFAQVYGWLTAIEVHPMVEPIPPVMTGALVGVLLGWIMVRWTSRKR
jgi:hypothetical protein